jgi:hypothetical protein
MSSSLSLGNNSKTRASAANPTRPGDAPVTLRKRLTKQNLHDLLIIWGRDQRIPSLKSRRQWALQRGLAPSTVSSWFYRRRARHIRLVGSPPTLTDPYDLNPSSPSNPIFEEPTGGTQSPDVGSNRADIVLNSDDTVCSNPSLDSGETVAATTQPLTSNTAGILSFANDLSGTSQAAQFLQSNEELVTLAAFLNRDGAVSSNIEKTLSPTLPCECVLCRSGALRIFSDTLHWTLILIQHLPHLQRCGFLGAYMLSAVSLPIRLCGVNHHVLRVQLCWTTSPHPSLAHRCKQKRINHTALED